MDELVTMLVQCDRFGTSIAESLRVHSDTLRTKRRQRAEEAAAKIPVKLLFPLILFGGLFLLLSDRRRLFRPDLPLRNRPWLGSAC